MSAGREDRIAVRRRGAGERGGVMLLVALLLPVVLGFAGAAVDVGNAYAVRSMLQHAVDDGALSAERWSTQAADGAGVSAPAVLQAAASEALRVAQDELGSAGLAASIVTAAPSAAGLTLAAEARVPTFFLGLFGIPAWTVVARSDAPWWTAPTSSAAGPSGGTLGGDNGPAGLGETADAGGEAPEPAAAEAAEPVGPCNCDSIAAGDPAAAAAALESMGATPTNPGPFAGDLTAAMGFGAMQSSPETDAAASDESADASSDATDGSSDASAGDSSGESSSSDAAGGDSGDGSDNGAGAGSDSGGGDDGGGGDGGDGF